MNISKFMSNLFNGTNESNTETSGPLWNDLLNKQKGLIDGRRINELNPVLEYIEEEKLFIMDGGYIGFVLSCQPTNGVNDQIRTAYQGLLSEKYPDDTMIQLSLAALPRIDNFLRGYMVKRNNRMPGSDSELSDAMSQKVVEYYSKARKESLDKRLGIKPRDFEHWVTFKFPIKEQLPNQKELDSFREIKRKTLSTFEDLGMAPMLLNDSEWLSRMQTVFNHSENSSWRDKVKVDRKGILGRQILEPGSMVVREENGISFSSGFKDSNGFATAISLKQTPENLGYGDLINLLGDWQYGKRTASWNPFIMTLNVQVPNQAKAKEEYATRFNWLKKQAKGKMLEVVHTLKDQYHDYQEVEQEIRNAELCNVSLSMIVLGENKEQTMDATDKLVQSFKRQQYKFNIESVLAPSMILNSLPLGLDAEYIKLSDRFEEWSSTGAAFLIPHSASWKGNTAFPVLEFVTRFGQIFGLDLFQTDGGFNALICAATGKGKSFVTNKIISSYLGSGVANGHANSPDGAQIFVIDKGKSYENLTHTYTDSQFIEFNDKMDFSLDPFAQINDFYGKDGQAAMVHALLKAMASESGDLSDYQSTEMLTILTELWDEKGQQASVTEFAKRCENHPEKDIHRIGRQLRPWCEGQVYGDFFGKRFKPVNFNARLIVCEMDELSSNPHLAQVVLMSIINAAQHAMFLSGPDRRKLFILDEAWEYLKDRAGSKVNYLAEFLETGWRRFRKTRAAGICITQSLLDAYQSQAGIAIVNNSPWKLMLAQEPETIDKLKEMKAYDGTEQDYTLMKSVHTRKGYYSELFVRYGEQKEIVKFFVDQKTQLVYSTDPDDRALIAKYKDQGYDIDEAIDRAYEEKQKLKILAEGKVA